MYVDANNLYGWGMSQKFPLNGFKRKKICLKLMKTQKDSKKLLDLHSDLPFLPERRKINKCAKPVCNFYNSREYIIHMRALKQALNHGIIFKKYIE